MSTTKIKLTTLQKKAYRYLQQARQELGASDCNKITLDQAATVVDAKRMAVVATAIPTIGNHDSTTFKAFSSLVDIPDGNTFDLAVSFFKQEIQEDLPASTNYDLLIKPLADKVEAYWNTGQEDSKSLKRIYKITKNASSDFGDIKTIGAWSSNLFEKVAPVSADYLGKRVNKAAFMKSIGNLVPMQVGDYWVNGIAGLSPQKIFKAFKKGASKAWFASKIAFAGDDIYTDYKNENYANMAMRIISTGLGYTRAPQLQALGSALGLTRWAVDEYSKVAGDLIAKNFDQKRTKATPVDSWLVDAMICGKEDDVEEVINEKEPAYGDVRITEDEYNSKRIISPFVNSILSSNSASTFSPTFMLSSNEYKNALLEGFNKIGFSSYPSNLSYPSFDFKQVDGGFELANRVDVGTAGFTEGKGWLYQFPNGKFDLLTDFKGANSEDMIDFALKLPSGNTSGTLYLSSTPEMKNLGTFNLLRNEDVKNFPSIENYKKVPFELTVTSLSDTRLGAEVNDIFYDLGKTETISGYFGVVDTV